MLGTGAEGVMAKQKKLVIIGANDFQNRLILKAKERNIETHVFAWKSGDIGEKTADFFYPISIIEKEEILNKCMEIQPDGIISIASDLASITVNYVAEKMNLVGNGIESSIISTNKYSMRRAFEKNGDPSPKYYRSDELNEDVINKIEYPIIVKPIDRSGSRGVTKVTNKSDIMDAIKRAKEVSFEKKAMIEEFVDGEEYSVEYISYQGKHTFLALTKKYTTGAPNFIETGHMQPANVSTEILEEIKSIVTHALDSLLIKNGASHSEIKINTKGEIKIIEIGGRMGGDCIGSDLVQISTGYDFVSMVIDVACGIMPNMTKVCEPKTAEVHFIFGVSDMEQLNDIQKNNPEWIYRVSEIEETEEGHEVVDSSTRYGYYILRKD